MNSIHGKRENNHAKNYQTGLISIKYEQTILENRYKKLNENFYKKIVRNEFVQFQNRKLYSLLLYASFWVIVKIIICNNWECKCIVILTMHK